MKKIKKGGRTYFIVPCSKCSSQMRVRSDYIDKHSGVCLSCQGIGNKWALKHGDYKERLFKIWVGLKHRRYTYVPEICNEWGEYEVFKKWAINNGYSQNLTIDRKDNTKGYSPSNCQWITIQENAGKDKTIFTDQEKIDVYKRRKELGLTQMQMATLLNVSRNTIQRADKYAKGRI